MSGISLHHPSQLVEVDEVGEDDADVAVVLRVVLRQRLREGLLARHVVGDDVVEEPVRLVLHALHLAPVARRQERDVEAQAVRLLEPPVEQADEADEDEHGEDVLHEVDSLLITADLRRGKYLGLHVGLLEAV